MYYGVLSLNLKYQASLELITNIISAHADGGPHSQVCTSKTLCLAPINVSENFWRMCMQSHL